MSAVMTPYEPRPGSLAERAISHLRDMPAGAEITTAMLAAALQSQPLTLRTSLEFARGRGAIFSRQKGWHARSPMFWSLVDHDSAPSARATAREAGAARAPGAKKDATAGDARLHEGREAAQAPTSDCRVTKEQRHADERRALAPEGMRIALWSDGTLQIERKTVGGAAEIVLLCRDETRQLVQYLDSIAMEAVREGGT